MEGPGGEREHHDGGGRIGDIARLRAAKNAINIGGSATKELYLVDSVREQSEPRPDDRTNR